jgi:hypothetical protein
MSPKFIGDHIQLPELAPLLQRVSDWAQFDGIGLTVYLDSTDYSNRPDIRDDFRFPAFLWRKGDSLEGVPSALLPLMQGLDTSYIVWLAKSLLESATPRVIWVYAHEFRHFMQRRGAVDLLPVQRFLVERHTVEGFSGIGTQLEKPDELDSELFAKKALMALVGEEAYSLYIAECRTSTKGDVYFRRFFELERHLGEHRHLIGQPPNPTVNTDVAR